MEVKGHQLISPQPYRLTVASPYMSLVNLVRVPFLPQRFDSPKVVTSFRQPNGYHVQVPPFLISHQLIVKTDYCRHSGYILKD